LETDKRQHIQPQKDGEKTDRQMGQTDRYTDREAYRQTEREERVHRKKTHARKMRDSRDTPYKHT
jgi:hypothetical protein